MFERLCRRDRAVLNACFVFFLSCGGFVLLADRMSGQVPRAPESSRYGFVDDHVSTPLAAVQRARDAGFGWVHYVLFWANTNPTHLDCNADGVVNGLDECNFDWSQADAEIQQLADQGFNIYLRIAFPPTWTTGATYANGNVFYCYDPTQSDNVRIDDDLNCKNGDRRPGYRAEYSPNLGNSYPPSYDRSGDLRLFLDAAVRRYRDRVRAWGVGTEVHSQLFWQGTWLQFFDEMLAPAYDTIKAIDPTLVVVGPDDDQYQRVVVGMVEEGAFEYLLNLEVTKGRRVFDVVSFHFLNQTYTGELLDLDTKIKPLIDRTRRGRPFWLTETGYWGSDTVLDDQLQAAWWNRMLSGIVARPWIDKTFVYRLLDGNPTDFGILNEDSSPKPAYAAIQQIVTAQGTPRFYYLAEGATKSIFDLDIAIANPNDAAAPVKVSFLKPDGSVVLQTPTLAAKSRHTIAVDGIAGLENADVSTIVESTSGLPLAIERTMFWDSRKYGGHTDTAVQAPATRWYFAEGSQGFFDTYVLLANSNIVPATVTVTFLREGGAQPVQTVVAVGATARETLWAGSFGDLINQSFGILVESNQPIIAERAMYFGSNPFWSAGHESAGVTSPSTNWFLAEGATFAPFDMYVLLSNPNDAAAIVDVEFVTSGGASVPQQHLLAGKSRLTIPVDAVSGSGVSLANVEVSTRITSTLPIVAERAMYWGDTNGWYEAHNSFGLTSTGTRWVLAEGRHGNGGRAGANPEFESYILVYNTTDITATLTVTYLMEGGGSFTVAQTIGKGRSNVEWNAALANRAYGVLIEADQPIVVERAMYWRGSGGRFWESGSNAAAVKLQ